MIFYRGFGVESIVAHGDIHIDPIIGKNQHHSDFNVSRSTQKVNFLNEGSEPKFLERRETVKS